ncbi:hypothetical protein [Patulibacter minatonensis]|uniref:hypothetical protein n=1 Tax=Patulibacter minatonensis TaxID=298163 RepID=UPI0004787C02|nr:hypothetical protein [Patulibacter minatonensis]
MTLTLDHPAPTIWHLKVRSTAAMTSAGWAQQRRMTTINGEMTLKALANAAQVLHDDLVNDPPIELIPVRRTDR